MFRHRYDSPVGSIIMESVSGGTLSSLKLSGDGESVPCPSESGGAAMPLFQEVCRWLDLYFYGQNPQFDIPLELEGTEFQRVVWQTLLTIPYGQATTYKAVAEQVAHLLGRERMFVRAVAHAIGQNPIALIVPCHRVIGSNGSLTGYAYGLETKRFLLDLERLP